MVGCVRCKSIAAMSVTTAKMRTSSANDSMVYERRAAGSGRNGRRRDLQVPPIETAVSVTLADTGSIGRMVIRAISRRRRAIICLSVRLSITSIPRDRDASLSSASRLRYKRVLYPGHCAVTAHAVVLTRAGRGAGAGAVSE
jgi:hypothetical protein